MQFQSDILGMDVCVSSQQECTAFGVFGLAGLYSQLFTEEAYRLYLSRSTIYKPRLSNGEADVLYQKWLSLINSQLG